MVPRSYLDDIVAAHRRRAAADDRDWRARLGAAIPRRPTLRAALRAEHVAVIAEVKRRSPSRGPLAPDLDPGALAAAYEAGGAAAVSVLTDEEFFGGCAEDLRRAVAATRRPVLRKDFVVSENDVLDAASWGAAGLLLIVAALSDDALARLLHVARQLGLDALVEVHDEAELERALAVGADLVGINQRDLHTFAVDQERALRVAALADPSVVLVAESGLRDERDVAALAAAGIDAVLVGESLVTSEDPEAAVARLAAVARHPRG